MSTTNVYNVQDPPYNAKGDGVTDDTAAINAAITACGAAGGGIVYFPRAKYLCSGRLSVPQDVALQGVPPNRTHNVGSPLTQLIASTLLITDTTPGTVFLTLNTNNVTVQGLCFAYPNQVPNTASTPTAYPPTISYGSQGGIGGLTLRDLYFYNAYDAIDFGEPNGNALNILIEGCNIGAYRYGIKLDYCGGSVTILSTGWGNVWDNGGAPGTITTWAQNNGVALLCYRVDGLRADLLNMYRVGIGIAMQDSPDTGQVPRNGYGTITNLSIDSARIPIQCISTSSIGYKIAGYEIAANAVGGAVTNILMQAGGTGTPVLKLVNGQTRALQGVPHVQHVAGTLSFVDNTFNDDWSNANACIQPVGGVDLSIIGCSFGGSNANPIFKWADGLTRLVFVGNKVGTHPLPQNATPWNAGANPIIRDNRGLNPVGAMAAPAVGGSPWTYTNLTGFDQTLFVSGGTVSSITVAGVTTGLTSGAFSVPAGTAMVVTYTLAPTVTATGN